jgi:solute carrier family 25 carnitine/acylcarnitine transporter 20/29
LLSFEESEGSTCKILLSGGIAGVATWVSIFPLDVIKTRLQCGSESGRTATVSNGRTYSMASNFSGALHIAKEVYLKDGIRVFFRGLGVCSARAFIVNACQVRIRRIPRKRTNYAVDSGAYMNGQWEL